MRPWQSTLFLAALAIASWAGPAQAEPPSRPDRAPLDMSAIVPRANVASLGPGPILPVAPRYYSSGRPVRTTGTVLASLGGATFFAAGITAILAAAFSASLSDKCPNNRCVEGSTGADRLNDARGAARATDWLVGIGSGVLTSGTVLLIYSAVLERHSASLQYTPVLRAGPAGASLTVHF